VKKNYSPCSLLEINLGCFVIATNHASSLRCCGVTHYPWQLTGISGFSWEGNVYPWICVSRSNIVAIMPTKANLNYWRFAPILMKLCLCLVFHVISRMVVLYVVFDVLFLLRVIYFGGFSAGKQHC
jgi:hypothetical protein